MSKSIQTQNADTNLVKKFLDYTNCADASYALLEYIFSGEIKYKQMNSIPKHKATNSMAKTPPTPEPQRQDLMKTEQAIGVSLLLIYVLQLKTRYPITTSLK